MDEGLAGSQRQYVSWIHNLGKELSHFKWANQELANKLREVYGHASQPGDQGKMLNLNGRSQGSSERLPPVGRTEESRNAGRGQHSRLERVLKSREEIRELVHAPLPPTWRRSSLPTENQSGMEELRQQMTSEPPGNRVLHPGMALAQWSGTPPLPHAKPRCESHRSSLSASLLLSNCGIIDVRELVHAPLPPTWRRSSLPTENQSGMEELRQQMTSEPPGNRVLHPGMALAQWSGTPPLPHAKPRCESHRSSLSASLLLSNCGIIDVRRNPL
ncbi:UNVERIFIED_CONTAM: hypothetical protein FKN15_049146 [Acipenser sinensis]